MASGATTIAVPLTQFLIHVADSADVPGSAERGRPGSKVDKLAQAMQHSIASLYVICTLGVQLPY